jgi:hypothetical protein
MPRQHAGAAEPVLWVSIFLTDFGYLGARSTMLIVKKYCKFMFLNNILFIGTLLAFISAASRKSS